MRVLKFVGFCRNEGREREESLLLILFPWRGEARLTITLGQMHFDASTGRLCVAFSRCCVEDVGNRFLALNRFVSTLAASEKEGEDQGLCYRFCDVAGGYGR